MLFNLKNKEWNNFNTATAALKQGEN